MYILAIETTGSQLSVAVIDENKNVTVKTAQAGFNHLTNLIPLIDEISKEIGIEPKDYSAIAVSKGPGSFTGIRIGVTTARALAQVLEKKAIGVPTLESFLYHEPEFFGVVCPIFDARRNQVYAGAFRWREGVISSTVSEPAEKFDTLCKGAAYNLEDFLLKLDEAMSFAGLKEIMLYGDGIYSYLEKVETWAKEKGYIIRRNGQEVQNAGSVARLALDMFLRGQTLEYGELQPDYMRQPEAERNLAAKKEKEIIEKKNETKSQQAIEMAVNRK